MSRKLKVAVIGCGNIADCHLLAYEHNPNVEIFALCDPNKDNAKTKSERYHVSRVYTSETQMLDELPELDAVSVCTWNADHARCSIAALNAGKHVLCEKPMAMNTHEAAAMLNAAKQNHRLLMVGFVRRFGNDCRIAKDLIEKGYLGDIYYAKASYLRRNGCPGGWFSDHTRSGGGPLIDLGVHVIDLTRYLMGNPIPVSVYGAAYHELGSRKNIKTGKAYVSSVSNGTADINNVEDLAAAMIRYDNGSVLQVETSFSLNIEKDTSVIELFGTKGGLRIDPELTYYGEMDGYMTNVHLATQTALEFDGLFDAEINHFVDCIQNDLPCLAPAEDGVAVARILDAIYDSAKTKHETAIV